jgi:alpha-mannosidase
MNQLVLYVDRPRRWEAWDLDRDYRDRATLVDDVASLSVTCEHPLRCQITAKRRLGRASEIFQTYRLDAGSRHLQIHTEIDWHEERTLLRAIFPCAIRATHATFGTQFGCIMRPTHRNTSWEEARFEVPGHGWMDLSEPGFGVAILDDGKYGRSAHENVLGLSLVRSPSFPDAGADRGEHAFTYAIMPHGGDWRGAGVDLEAEALREPLRAVAIMRSQRRARSAAGALPSNWAPFRIASAPQCHVQVAAWKPAENGPGRVLRLVETCGGRGDVHVRWHVPAARVEVVDANERGLSDRGLSPKSFSHDRIATVTRFEIKPFQIVTLRVTER